jgi:hypothetical protein
MIGVHGGLPGKIRPPLLDDVVVGPVDVDVQAPVDVALR